MDIIELGAVGEIVGGVAVVASLIYVGLQIRQNTRGMKEASNRDTAFQNDRIIDFLLTDKEARTLWASATNNGLAKLLENPSSLDEDGLNYWVLFMYRVFNGFHGTYHSWATGALDDVHWAKQQAIITFYLATPMGKDFWHSTRDNWWDAAFVQHIDGMEAAAAGRSEPR